MSLGGSPAAFSASCTTLSAAHCSFTQARNRSLRVLDIGMGREGTVTDLENEPKRSKAQNGTPEEAKALLEKAVAAVKEDKSKALDMFNKGPLGSSARVIELGGPIHPSGVSSQ
jgi:hypothetical protein